MYHVTLINQQLRCKVPAGQAAAECLTAAATSWRLCLRAESEIEQGKVRCIRHGTGTTVVLSGIMRTKTAQPRLPVAAASCQVAHGLLQNLLVALLTSAGCLELGSVLAAF